MKSFAPTFNLSVLNLSLKSGIWVGVTAISFASAAVTVVNNWELIRKEVEDFYEVTIKTYIMNPLFKTTELMKKNMISGYSALYQNIKDWHTAISSSKLREWMEKNLTREKLKNSYYFLFSTTGWYFEKFTKILFNKNLLKEENIKNMIIMLVGAGEYFINLLKSLGTKDNRFKVIFELIKKLFSDSNFFSIVHEYASTLYAYPEIIKHLSMGDIGRALNQSTDSYYARFKKNSEDLRKNPIKGLKGMALKNEVMKRLFPDSDCTFKENLASGLWCAAIENLEEMFKGSTTCPEGNCEEKVIVFEGGVSMFNDALNALGKMFENGRRKLASLDAGWGEVES